jgi:hypothetical protein
VVAVEVTGNDTGMGPNGSSVASTLTRTAILSPDRSLTVSTRRSRVTPPALDTIVRRAIVEASLASPPNSIAARAPSWAAEATTLRA